MPADFFLIPILPELFLAFVAMGFLIVGVDRGNDSTTVLCFASCFALVAAGMLMFGKPWDDITILNNMFKFDAFAAVVKLLILLGSIITLALSARYLEQENIARFEYPVLVLTATVGMMLMVSANNLLSLYMALELQSLSLYVLAAFQRRSARAAEAGVKYFVLGAISSGMILFGISLIYGFTGSIDYKVIADTLSDWDTVPIGVTFGLVFLLAGIAFKISAAPFHMWTPDVYQGAPTSVTTFFAMVPKVAAMVLLIRLLYEPLISLTDQWQQILYFLSVFSMVLGAFAALVQEDIKRLLAYSSIGHMGYALIGVTVASESGLTALIIYLLIYMVMTAGVFAIVMMMRRDGIATYRIVDLSGMSHTHPGLAYALAILMFSMSGIPPLAGFFGKLFIFQAAVAHEFYILAVLGVLSSVVAAYYYLRIIKVAFFDEPAESFDRDFPFARQMILALSVLFVLLFVLNPTVVTEVARSAVGTLFS